MFSIFMQIQRMLHRMHHNAAVFIKHIESLDILHKQDQKSIYESTGKTLNSD